jgi:hypothetical protein
MIVAEHNGANLFMKLHSTFHFHVYTQLMKMQVQLYKDFDIIPQRDCRRNLTTMKWSDATTQIREQMSGPDLHVFTLKFLALKKTGSSPIKNTFQIFFDFCLPLFYATFQCGP